MKGLPKKYAKMGFKAGWAAFKRSKSKRRKGVSNVAKRRKGGFRRRATKGYRRAKKGMTMSNITKVLAGAGLAALYEVFVSPIIPVDQTMKAWVELGAGLFLAAWPKMPMFVRAFGAALATINAYSIAVPLIQQYAGGGEGATDANY